MKKIFIIAVVAVSAIFTTNSAQGKMGHVNTQKLLDTMPSYKAAKTNLADLEALYMKELQELNKSFEIEATDYQAKMTTMTPTVRKYTEDRLQKKQGEIQQRQEELGQMLQVEGQNLNKPILERVKKAIEIVAAREKMSYVIEETQALYTAGGIDITTKAINELLVLDAAAMKAAVTPK